MGLFGIFSTNSELSLGSNHLPEVPQSSEIKLMIKQVDLIVEQEEYFLDLAPVTGSVFKFLGWLQ